MTVGLDLSLVISSSNHFQHIIASNRGNPSIGNGYNPYLEDDRDSGNDKYDRYNDNDRETSRRYEQASRNRGRNINNAPGYTPKSGLDTVGGLLKNQKQLGAGLVGVGMLLTFMGMMLFFEGNLLRLGNICIILGIPLLVGPNRVKKFFLKESRMQASIVTSLGIFLVFYGKPRLGIICEIFGLLNLFGNMFPLLLALAKKMPIIGDVLSSFDDQSNRKNKYPNF